jgi:hypothetical protein
MSSETSIWYRLGYTIEQARRVPSRPKRALRGLADRARPKPSRERPDSPARRDPLDELAATGAVALAVKALDAWRPRSRTGLSALVRAGAAGAAAALAVELLRPLLAGRREAPALGADAAERILEGAGQGLIYGAVVEPRLPGPPLLKGTLYGSAEYAVVPAGGLVKLLGPHGPLHDVPLVSGLMKGAGGHERSYLEHVAFGISLALLYGSSPSSNGIREEPES